MRLCLFAAAAAFFAPAAFAECRLDPSRDGPFANTVIAFEHSDRARTHRFPCAAFGGAFEGANKVAARQLGGDWPTPYNLVIGEDGARYVYGGAYGDHPRAEGSFIARIDPDGEEAWRAVLFDAKASPGEWNYPGVITLHRNGGLYAVFRNRFARLDPATGAVVASVDLPFRGPAADSAYNGFNAFADGRLVMKTVNRRAGCALQGFSAFLRCEKAREVPASVIAVVDPDSMLVLAEVEAPEAVYGRLTTTRFDGRELLYLMGAENIYRYVWDGERLVPDPAWGPVPYILDGQTPAPAASILGDFIVAQTNAVPGSAPMSLIAVSQRDGALTRVDPFTDLPFWARPIGARSFLPSMLTVDPENARIFVMDAGLAHVAAFDLDLATGAMTRRWRAPQRTLHFSTLVGPPDERVMVATDVAALCLTPACLRSYKTERVVYRDAATGRVLARSAPLPRMTSGALVTPGEDGVMHYLGIDGAIFELSVAPQQSAAR